LNTNLKGTYAMFKSRSPRPEAQEAAEDIFFGQIAIIWARWFLIAAGAIIALLSADDILQLAIAILTVVILMAINFATHGFYLTGQPVNKFLLFLTSFADIAVITFLVLTWNGHAGMDSQFFILYYPMLFTFALVFPRRITVLFSMLTLGVYGAACLITDPSAIFSINGLELLAIRLVTLGAMAGMGTYYYRRQRAALRSLKASPFPAFK
jgi:hypothetical protein